MNLPDYWMTRPGGDAGEETSAAFDGLLRSTLELGGNHVIPYALTAPKWQFLCHAAERHNLALHGSGRPDISVFEPRQSVDLNPFGNRKAVYAASDGIWAIFFAVVDRDSRVMSVSNACIRLFRIGGRVDGPFYVFSISKPALSLKPWREGVVYLLPPDTFSAHPPLPFGGAEVRIAQLASMEPVTPIARLEVGPGDFPFLDQIREHDHDRLQEYADALQTGAPWPGEA